MKKIKILAIILTLLMTFALFGCDMILGMAEDESNDNSEENPSGDGENPGDDSSDNSDGHTCDYKLVSTKDATCESKGEKLYKCSCGKTKTEVIPESHVLAVQEKKDATCTEEGMEKCTYCSVCKLIIEGGEVIDKLPHNEVIDPATEATATSPAKTEGKHCSECGYVIVKQQFIFSNDYSNPESYDGKYAYESLTKLNNAEKLTKLYNLIDEKADYFHLSSINVNSGNGYTFATIDYSALGLSAEEAFAAWSAYRTDHPLYYWFSGSITYTSKEINLIVDEEYASASVRSEYNSKIYSTVEKFVKEASSDTAYNTALAFHDLIILAVDYAYEDDGETPSDETWAHNIIGVFDVGFGVCESYAKTFQLFLNFCDIENIIVSGYAGEPHAWNLIKLDDGEWYWCDLTWDDTPDFMWGISYQYFCVNDTQNIGWVDGPWTVASESFLGSHAPYAKVDTGVNYTYDLPARSENEYSAAEIMLRDTFTVSGLTYAVAGYNSVQLVYINKTGDVIIPESVEYKGTQFDVISIGKIDNGLFKTGPINYDGTDFVTVTSVSIPKSVIFIWDNAFNMESLTAINVDSSNTEFSSVDGVLFTKDLSVLIKYPAGKSAKTYALPDETVEIAADAFRMFYINLNLKLESITLGINTVSAGIANYGYGYENSEKGNFKEDEWVSIREYLSGIAEIYNKDGSVFAEN